MASVLEHPRHPCDRRGIELRAAVRQQRTALASEMCQPAESPRHRPDPLDIPDEFLGCGDIDRHFPSLSFRIRHTSKFKNAHARYRYLVPYGYPVPRDLS